ncbi:hypothetical protein [Methanohalobium sp.]|uniref:hypothetical protein n=1 Tax=Methanohalobium sp. TaxID=2837493 RepID=UPI0025F8B523|nr:hypothetical protein [Methanohalobium sp.]
MFKLVESKNDENHHAILVTDERYRDVVYQYNWVKIPENVEDLDKDENVELSFHYEVIDNPHGYDVNSKEFGNLAGDILAELIQYHVDTQESESE